ncbi:tripartite tricarboxylate transporter substrate binding protein [Sediminicoccus sp. KRV36]|uniref:Bug family tripartite tricarboxylate transporter substrate binding protein n=1 Tax=Sediminicoccus sp. KRV36 TaxID=3133721 RepID=UPI00200DC450|nr:tripartite tricarboxylate transporter substrate binding protein [Sediminicoccus rosea]UPY39263.1 tripartite tricarboxylate transporter substrate binding protein [Sediminicoccus rosea]
MFRRSLLPLLAAPALVFRAQAQAAWVPERPIRIVAPFAAGGAADVMARFMADELGPLLNQQVVVENRTGAGGAVGTEFVARARPDGYTLVCSGQATHGIVPVLTRLSFDPATDTTPIANFAGVPAVLIVNNELPIRSVAEFIAYVRARPGLLAYGSAGIGASTHMAMALLAQKTGLDMTHVPYRGTALAMPDLMAGRLGAIADNIPGALAFIRDGRVRALGVSTPVPLGVLPDVPSISATVPGYDVLNWYGLHGPAGLPAPIVTTLHTAIQTILARPAFRARLAAQGTEALPMSTAEFAAYVARDRAQWAELQRATGLRAD